MVNRYFFSLSKSLVLSVEFSLPCLTHLTVVLNVGQFLIISHNLRYSGCWLFLENHAHNFGALLAKFSRSVHARCLTAMLFDC